LGRALQNLKVIPEHQTTYTTLTQDELNTFDYVKEILKASNYGLSIKGIVFTAIL
jgi:phosphoesterase RecJ-like protein